MTAKPKSGSGVPPLNQQNKQSRDAAATASAAPGHQSQNTASPEEAREWPSIRIGNALELINGRAFKPAEWSKAGVPIVRIQNLNNPEAPFNYYEGNLPEKFSLGDGDLLFAWSGT